MGGFKNQDLNLIFSEGVWENIKKTLLICSKSMREDALISSHFIENHEEIIRNRLLKKYLDNDEFREQMRIDQLNLRFEPEVPEHFDEKSDTYQGRTDIRVINKNFFKTNKAYHTIECKRIDGGYTLNKKYVTEGIARFVSYPILYPSHYHKNLMFGFVVKPIDINANSTNIDAIQQSELQDYIINGLHMIGFEDTLFYFYSCEYNITGKEILELQHLFFDFSPIINPS